MAKRKGTNAHYEQMFENFLRKNNLLYIVINEAKRPIYAGKKVKNFDFIVKSARGHILLIDIKGKQFPYENKSGGKNYWENWVSSDDTFFLQMWEQIFGQEAIGLLVFVYHIKHSEDKKHFDDTFEFKKKTYGLVAITAKDYSLNSKMRSNAGERTFNAISVSRERFRNLVKPFSYYLNQTSGSRRK
jgi:hypothetical protein